MTFGAMPLGNLTAGLISENMGAPVATLVACGLVVVAASVVMTLFPSIRRL